MPKTISEGHDWLERVYDRLHRESIRLLDDRRVSFEDWHINWEAREIVARLIREFNNPASEGVQG